MTVRERDPITGRPLKDGREAPPDELSDLELDEELLVAAAGPGRLRLNRFESLVAELARRRPTPSAS
jgi:hypothetical protein